MAFRICTASSGMGRVAGEVPHQGVLIGRVGVARQPRIVQVIAGIAGNDLESVAHLPVRLRRVVGFELSNPLFHGSMPDATFFFMRSRSALGVQDAGVHEARSVSDIGRGKCDQSREHHNDFPEHKRCHVVLRVPNGWPGIGGRRAIHSTAWRPGFVPALPARLLYQRYLDRFGQVTCQRIESGGNQLLSFSRCYNRVINRFSDERPVSASPRSVTLRPPVTSSQRRKR